MREIHCGEKIALWRRERGITQEALADHVGVSKPAVSKWESGQSYPDITLLPVLASYFNRSVDELLGYKAQMDKEQIRKVYARFSAAFTEKPFEEVYGQVLETVRIYYSCPPLLLQMGMLMLNHAPLAQDPKRIQEVIQKAAEWFRRVSQESKIPAHASQAVVGEAACQLYSNRPDEVIRLLGDHLEARNSGELLLAQAYQQKGENGRSQELLQQVLFENLMGILSAVPYLMQAQSEEPQRMKDWYRRGMEMGRLFDLDQVQPCALLTVCISSAQLMMAAGEEEGAMEALAEYGRLAGGGLVFPLKLKSGGIFDALDSFFEELELGAAPPRDEAAVRQDLQTLMAAPLFEPLRQRPEYQQVLRQLEQI